MTGPWDAARARQRQTPRRYVKVAPVGERVELTFDDIRKQKYFPPSADAACLGCGRHVCSCEPRQTQMRRPSVGYDGVKLFESNTHPPDGGLSNLLAEPQNLTREAFDIGARALYRAFVGDSDADRPVLEPPLQPFTLEPSNNRQTLITYIKRSGAEQRCEPCCKPDDQPHYCERGECECRSCRWYERRLGTRVDPDTAREITSVDVDCQCPESHSQAVVSRDSTPPQQNDGDSHPQLVFAGRPLEVGHELKWLGGRIVVDGLGSGGISCRGIVGGGHYFFSWFDYETWSKHLTRS